MIIAADYPFMDIFWTMLLFFFWVLWFWSLVIILTDVFGRTDIGGWTKASWTLLLIFVPLFGMLVYLIVHGRDMAERRTQGTARAQAQLDDHIRTVAAGPADGNGGASGEIARAKELLDSGVIDATEFAQLKRRALAV